MEQQDSLFARRQCAYPRRVGASCGPGGGLCGALGRPCARPVGSSPMRILGSAGRPTSSAPGALTGSRCVSFLAGNVSRVRHVTRVLRRTPASGLTRIATAALRTTPSAGAACTCTLTQRASCTCYTRSVCCPDCTSPGAMSPRTATPCAGIPRRTRARCCGKLSG